MVIAYCGRSIVALHSQDRLHHVKPHPHEEVVFAFDHPYNFWTRQQLSEVSCLTAAFFEAMPLKKSIQFFLQKYKSLFLPE